MEKYLSSSYIISQKNKQFLKIYSNFQQFIIYAHSYNFIRRLKQPTNTNMSFIKKLFNRNKHPLKQQKDLKPSMIVMESDTLGMTVVEQTGPESDEIKQITNEEWISIIDNKGLSGVPYSRIYYSFLKGIPNFLRLKIWLLLCTENSSKNYKFTGIVEKRYSKQIRNSKEERNSFELKEEKEKNIIEKEQGSVLTIFTTELYQKLSTSKPQQKQSEQIEKDVHRTYSNKPEYKFTSNLLRKLLFSLSNSGVEYSQGMNYILLYVIVYCLQSLGIERQDQFDAVNLSIERDIFIILREIVLRLEQVFDSRKIFEVLKELEEKISETMPDIFYIFFKMGMDTYSLFSQNYYSLMTYSDPPEEFTKMMMDLFFLEGDKAITSTIVRMMQISSEQILKIKEPERMQSFIKNEMFHYCFDVFVEERKKAKAIEDFGISFYQNIEKY